MQENYLRCTLEIELRGKKDAVQCVSSPRRYALFKCSVGRQPLHTYVVMQERAQGI